MLSKTLVETVIVPETVAPEAGEIPEMMGGGGWSTVRMVEFPIEPEVAAIVVQPEAMLLARPWLPDTLLMAATLVAEELQLTEGVTSCILPSLNVPVAVNC
jgi:hypothetical protein